jgi:hypothetical protein
MKRYFSCASGFEFGEESDGPLCAWLQKGTIIIAARRSTPSPKMRTTEIRPIIFDLHTKLVNLSRERPKIATKFAGELVFLRKVDRSIASDRSEGSCLVSLSKLKTSEDGCEEKKAGRVAPGLELQSHCLRLTVHLTSQCSSRVATGEEYCLAGFRRRPARPSSMCHRG